MVNLQVNVCHAEGGGPGGIGRRRVNPTEARIRARGNNPTAARIRARATRR